MAHTKHTPGPWKFRKWEGEKWPDKRWSVGPERDGISTAICISPRFDSAEAEANAQFIVRACNCHEELLENLQMAISMLSSPYFQSDKESEKLISKMEQAIAKAEGKE